MLASFQYLSDGIILNSIKAQDLSDSFSSFGFFLFMFFVAFECICCIV